MKVSKMEKLSQDDSNISISIIMNSLSKASSTCEPQYMFIDLV